MRNFVMLLLWTITLAGCGENQTPLTHALAAFRAGNHDDFLAAKAEAVEAQKKAIQPGDDLCMMTMMDIERYGTTSVLDKMDQPDLWRMNEEARLAYALKLAGKHLVIEPGSLLSRAPLYTAVSGEGNAVTCVGEHDKQMAAMMGAGPEARDADEARMEFMQGWMRDMKSRDGGQFDNRMRSAVNGLENAGYSANWPAEIDFIE